MFGRSLNDTIELMESYFHLALLAEAKGNAKSAEMWLAKAIDVEARAFR